MTRSLSRLALLALLTAAFCSMGTFAYAQGATTQTLSGSVVDASGAVIPGADITAKHTGTGIASRHGTVQQFALDAQHLFGREARLAHAALSG